MFEEEAPRREASIRDFLRVVFRYKWVLVILFVVSTTVVAAINVRSPVLYESEARVLVRRGQLENMVDVRYRYLTWQEEVLSELETVKSYSVLARAREIHIDLDRMPPDLKDQLKALPFVLEANQKENTLVVKVPKGGDYRKDISAHLIKQNLVPLRIQEKTLSLEEAFVTITEENIEKFAEIGGRK